jgi:tripartite-type tricarboxylate transporter receptor subunit TctC
LVAPAGTPKAIIDKLHQESVAALQSKEVRDQYAVFGFETIGNTPEQYGSQIREDLVRWGAMVKLAKVPMQ